MTWSLRDGLRAGVLTGALALGLSACNAHPGAAAVVGSERISDGRVDDVAGALCAAQGASQGGAVQDLASRAARQGAVQLLVDSSLSQQYAASVDAEPDAGQVSAAVQANEAAIASVPAADRTVFRETVQGYAEGQLALVEVGRRELKRRGTKNVTEQQALGAGTALRNTWVAAHLDVDVDPRFGRFRDGALVSRSGSLSVPVSSTATQGAAAQPSATWVARLPATQKCS